MSKWKQQKLSFTDSKISFITILEDMEKEENEITEPLPPPKYIDMKRKKISVKEGYKLAKGNKSIKNWVRATPPTNPPPIIQKEPYISVEEEEENKKLEEPDSLDMEKSQRLAECRAKQTAFLTQNICASLVEGMYTEMEARMREDWEIVANKGVDMMMDKLGQVKDVTFSSILEEEAELENIFIRCEGEVKYQTRVGDLKECWMEEWRPMEDMIGMEYEVWMQEELGSMGIDPPDRSTRIMCRSDLGLAITNTVSRAITNTLSSATPRPVCTRDDDLGPTVCSTPRTLLYGEMNVEKCQAGVHVQAKLGLKSSRSDKGLAITNTVSHAITNTLSSATPKKICTRDDEFGPTVCSTPRTLLYEEMNVKKCQTGVHVQAKLGLKSSSSSNISEVSFSSVTPSRKSKPWHVIKKRGIIPDGLVQTRLNHFRLLTNGEGGNIKQICSTNESPGKRRGSYLNSPKAEKQRKQ